MSSGRNLQRSIPQNRRNSKSDVDYDEYVPSALSDPLERFTDKRYNYDPTPQKSFLEQQSNHWRQHPQYDEYNSSVDELNDRFIKSLTRILNKLRSPRIRRYLAIWLVLLVTTIYTWRSFIYPVWHEEWALRMSLSEMNEEQTGGWFGVNVRPTFSDLVMVKTLDKSLVPKNHARNNIPEPGSRRLIFIGDIHGCKKEFEDLLKKVKFNQETDHLVLLGDIITKGPDSLGVVDLAMKLGASSVRGNHEDRVILLRKTIDASHHVSAGPVEPGVVHDETNQESISTNDDPDSILAQQLTQEQYKWLASCPVVLRIGVIGKLGEVLAVHAGLVPGIDPERQDPNSVMTMRSIDLGTHVPSKLPALGIHKESVDSKLTPKEKTNRMTLVPWPKLWNKYQNLIPNPKAMWAKDHSKLPKSPSTVIYGHDSKRGIQLQKWTKGLDSGCVKGGQLTAMVVGDGGHTFMRQVECRDRRVKTRGEEGEETVKRGNEGLEA